MSGYVLRPRKAANILLRSRKPAKISVWWDVGTCPVPRRRFHVKAIAKNIKSALKKLGYRGPVSISAYGDTSDIPRSDQRAAGISFYRVRPGSYDLLLSLVGWAIDNPSPANILIISGHDFISDALSFLDKRGYNILLALPRKAYPPRFVTTTMWFWGSLLAGGSPIGRSSVDEEEIIEAECLGAKTSVWWQIENKLPNPRDLEAIPLNIKCALKNLGYSGPVYFYAFGDIPDDLFPPTTEIEIILYNLPADLYPYPGERESEMLFHLMNWALQNPPPANLLLISGDSVFSAALHHLVESGYNILLAQPKSASCATLAKAAKTEWIWDDLFAGGSPIKCSQVVSNVSSTVRQGDKVPIPRYRKAEYMAAKTSVWWDMEDCPPPRHWDQSFAENINRALLHVGFRGPVSIFAYRYNDHDRRASLSGISLNPIASGEVKSSKYLTDTKMLVEMFAWALENAPPANILLISRDLDFCSTLEVLKMRGFNILLGTNMTKLCAPMVEVASTVWPYLALLAGDPPSDKESALAELASTVWPYLDLLAGVPPPDKESALAELENDSTGSSSRLVI